MGVFSTRYYEMVSVPIELKPCIKCKSTNIELWDNGNNTFNKGGGRCLSCKYQIESGVHTDATHKMLADIWNAANDVAARVQQIDAEIVLLQEERERILS